MPHRWIVERSFAWLESSPTTAGSSTASTPTSSRPKATPNGRSSPATTRNTKRTRKNAWAKKAQNPSGYATSLLCADPVQETGVEKMGRNAPSNLLFPACVRSLKIDQTVFRHTEKPNALQGKFRLLLLTCKTVSTKPPSPPLPSPTAVVGKKFILYISNT